MEDIFSQVAKKKGVKLHQVENTMKLLDDGATVPFVSRYRKEATGNLDEVQITEILEEVQYLRNLEKRKEEVLRLIEEQGKLTEELVQAIGVAEKLQEDRKSTRLNSSHANISYAVFCLKKKKLPKHEKSVVLETLL